LPIYKLNEYYISHIHIITNKSRAALDLFQELLWEFSPVYCDILLKYQENEIFDQIFDLIVRSPYFLKQGSFIPGKYHIKIGFLKIILFDLSISSNNNLPVSLLYKRLPEAV